MANTRAKAPVPRRAVLATAAAALAGAGVAKFGRVTPARALVVKVPLEMNTGDTTVVNNVATARTNLRADRGSTHTLTLQNIGTSTTATRGTLYAYLGNNTTLPPTEETSAIRGVNETTDPGGSGISGEGPRGVFGESNHPEPALGRGVVGTSDPGIGVEGFSDTGIGVHGFAGGPDGIGVKAEGASLAFVAAGPAEFQDFVAFQSEAQFDASGLSPDEPALHIAGLAQGVGMLVARSTDSGVTHPSAGFSDGFAGIMVDLVSSDITLPTGAGLAVATGSETGAVLTSASGTALEVHGPSLFDGPASFTHDLVAKRIGGLGGVAPAFQNAGVATIPAGKTAVRVTNASVKPGTSVIATLQGNAGRDVVLKHVSVLNGRFNVVLNRKAAQTTRVAYFVLGES